MQEQNDRCHHRVALLQGACRKVRICINKLAARISQLQLVKMQMKEGLMRSMRSRMHHKFCTTIVVCLSPKLCRVKCRHHDKSPALQNKTQCCHQEQNAA